jgi:outer membrane protein TolC
MEFNQALGGGRPSDIDQTEVTGLLRFSVPIGRNEAKGRVEAIDAQIAKLEQEKTFAKDRIMADATDAYSAVHAAYNALGLTSTNVELAMRLEAAEADKFEEGASDLLALQIREQSTFDAKLLEINAQLAYFKSMADYQAAVATDAPASLLAGAK